MNFGPYTLRLIRQEDAEAFLRLVQDNQQRIQDYLPVTAATVTNSEAAEKYVREKMALTDEREHYCLLIDDTDAKTLAGVFFIKNLDWHVPKAELGYFVDHAYEGQGVMTQAMALTIRFCFDVLGLNKIYLRTGITNTGSRRLAEKNGFVQEGILHKDFRIADGTLVDLAYYGLVNPALIGSA